MALASKAAQSSYHWDMDQKIIDPSQARDLAPDLLDEQGRMRSVPASFFASTTVIDRAVFGLRHAAYGFITDELIWWLQRRIAGRKAIEIGAGNGDLARHLGIVATDSRMQERADIREYYAAMQQPVISYGPEVLKLPAKDAVRNLSPQVVVASWVTHLYDPRRHEAGGNMYGVDELDILSHCEEYIFIGNTQVHATKLIAQIPHERFEPDWLYSRAHNGSANFIAVWKGKFSKS